MKFSEMPEFSKVAVKAISLPLYNWFIEKKIGVIRLAAYPRSTIFQRRRISSQKGIPKNMGVEKNALKVYTLT